MRGVVILAFTGAMAATVFLRPVAAQAAPGQVQPTIEISPNATLMTPASLNVEVEASCAPWSGSTGTADVIVEQAIPATTSANEGEGMMSIPCDGVKRKVIVNVTGGPFQKGIANAFGQLIAGPLLPMNASDARKLNIAP